MAAGDRGAVTGEVKRRRKPYEVMRGAERIHALYERAVHLRSVSKIAEEMGASK